MQRRGLFNASSIAPRILIDHPYLGQPYATTIGILELRVAKLPHILPYRVVSERIEIIRVFHESRDRPSAWHPSR
ncbi:MAG: type II toxin-antitoxin system RelE/ParE family toxin [Hyphomicrobiales bacterium]|nr:type II toxin-antitoxin system RelE/ParE family toxin [Hyphomicrobiales bacterium]